MALSDLLTVSDIADEMKVPTYDIHNIVRLRRIEPTRRIGRAWLFDRPTAERIKAELKLKQQRQAKEIELWTLADIAEHFELPELVVQVLISRQQGDPAYYLVSGDPLYDIRDVHIVWTIVETCDIPGLVVSNVYRGILNDPSESEETKQAIRAECVQVRFLADVGGDYFRRGELHYVHSDFATRYVDMGHAEIITEDDG